MPNEVRKECATCVFFTIPTGTEWKAIHCLLSQKAVRGTDFCTSWVWNKKPVDKSILLQRRYELEVTSPLRVLRAIKQIRTWLVIIVFISLVVGAVFGLPYFDFMIDSARYLTEFLTELISDNLVPSVMISFVVILILIQTISRQKQNINDIQETLNDIQRKSQVNDSNNMKNK